MVAPQDLRSARVAFYVAARSPVEGLPGTARLWREHEDAVLAAADAASPTVRVDHDVWVVWRLLSGNNRELARGVGEFDSVYRARGAAQRAIDNVHALEGRVIADPATAASAWCLWDEGAPVLISAGWRRVRREIARNLAVARDALGSAEVNESTTVLGELDDHQLDQLARAASAVRDTDAAFDAIVHGDDHTTVDRISDLDHEEFQT